MIIPAHLNFFSIEECGLYKRDSSASKGLEASETFQLIYEWVQGKPLEDTIPWDPLNSRSGSSNCYCHDIYKCENTEDFVLVLWKSDANSAGSIWGAQASATPGNAKVVEYTNGYKGKRVIWGRPCYYWVIPKLRSIASIKVEHSVCDSQMLQDWVSKCITNRVKHPNKKRVETDTGQPRFSFTDSSDVSGAKYAFRFDVRLRSLNTSSAELQGLANRITHIVRRDTIRLQVGTDDRDDWLKIFDGIPYLPTKPKAKTRQIEVRAEAKPSVLEIKSIIEKFSKEERKRSDWNNVGFETDTGTVWVDRYRLHETVNYSQDKLTVIPASAIHAQLSKNREKLLLSIQRDEKLKLAAKKAIG
jgi:hypothetical protein